MIASTIFKMNKIKEFYDNKYATASLRGISDLRFEKTLEQFKRKVDCNPHWTMLDIGCGIGGFMRLSPFKHNIGLDVSENAIQKAKTHGLEVYQCDIEHDKIPLDDCSVDVVFCMEVFEHLLFEDNAINEIKRVLKPGGYLMITVPNEILWIYSRLKILRGTMIRRIEPYPYDNQHLRYFESKALKMLAEKHRLEVIYNGALPLSYKKFRFGWVGRFLSDHWPNIFPITYSMICKKGDRLDGTGTG